MWVRYTNGIEDRLPWPLTLQISPSHFSFSLIHLLYGGYNSPLLFRLTSSPGHVTGTCTMRLPSLHSWGPTLILFSSKYLLIYLLHKYTNAGMHMKGHMEDWIPVLIFPPSVNSLLCDLKSCDLLRRSEEGSVGWSWALGSCCVLSCVLSPPVVRATLLGQLWRLWRVLGFAVL